MKPSKLFQRIQSSQQNVAFADLLRLVVALGFRLDRVKGSHNIFVHSTHPEAMLNLQRVGGEAKPYQVRQLLVLVEQHDLKLDEDSHG